MATTYRTTDLKAYAKEKIRMLKRDFKIALTDEQISRLSTATSDIAIDNFARQLIRERLETSIKLTGR